MFRYCGFDRDRDQEANPNGRGLRVLFPSRTAGDALTTQKTMTFSLDSTAGLVLAPTPVPGKEADTGTALFTVDADCKQLRTGDAPESDPGQQVLRMEIYGLV